MLSIVGGVYWIDVQNDPINLYDPYGLMSGTDALIILGWAAAAAEPSPAGEAGMAYVTALRAARTVSLAAKITDGMDDPNLAPGGPCPNGDDNDQYENPGHHDPSGGPNSYNPQKSVLPKNHQELWKNSRLAADGNRWVKVGSGKKAVYHRFANNGNGRWHWNGSTSGVTKSGRPRVIRPNDIPKEVKRW